jgi:hypothetical protein
MRGLSLVDILIILAVLAALLFAGSKEFALYSNSTIAPTAPAMVPTATAPPAS